MPASRRPGAAGLARRHRRSLAGTSVAVAVLAMGLAMREPAVSEPVLVAATDLPIGHRLVESDLAVAHVPHAGQPPGTTRDPSPLLGRVLAAPVSRGEAFSATRLIGPRAWATPPGTTPLPVRFADAGAARLLWAGQRIDVLAAAAADVDGLGFPPAAARVVAGQVLVLSVITDGGSVDEATAWSTGSATAPLVVLATTRSDALAIAGAQAGGSLWFAFAGGAP